MTFWDSNHTAHCKHCNEPAQSHSFTPIGGYWRLACPISPKAKNKGGRRKRAELPQSAEHSNAGS